MENVVHIALDHDVDVHVPGAEVAFVRGVQSRTGTEKVVDWSLRAILVVDAMAALAVLEEIKVVFEESEQCVQ